MQKTSEILVTEQENGNLQEVIACNDEKDIALVKSDGEFYVLDTVSGWTHWIRGFGDQIDKAKQAYYALTA